MQIIAQTSPEYSQEKLGHQGDSLERPRDTWLIHIFFEGCMCLKWFYVEDIAYSLIWIKFGSPWKRPDFLWHLPCIPTCINSLLSESNLGDVITDHFHFDKIPGSTTAAWSSTRKGWTMMSPAPWTSKSKSLYFLNPWNIATTNRKLVCLVFIKIKIQNIQQHFFWQKWNSS